MDKLPDQSLPACHIGVRLHPHSAVCNPLSALYCLLNPGKKLRVIFFAHFIRSRLALDKLIFRVFLNQPKLGSKGSLRLAVGLSHGPEPGKIQMGISHRIKNRGCGAVLCLHHRAQRLSGLLVGRNPPLSWLLEVRNQGKLLQRLCNPGSPKRVFLQSGEKHTQG